MLNSSRRECWLISTGLAVFTLFFYWKVLFTNRVMFPWDIADFFYPTLNYVHEELRHFRLPLWDPYVMSGFPIIGDPEAQIFYPPNWLLVLVHPFGPLPYKLVELQLILHFLLAGVFMYYLAKSYVRSMPAALISAVLFEFSGAMVAHTQHMASIESIAWYPLIFLLARRGLLENRFPLTVGAGALFGIQILVGHAQHAVYLGLLLFLYFAYEACLGHNRKRIWPRWIYSLAVIGGIGAAVAMVQLIPSAELSKLSVRSYITRDDVTAGNEPQYLLTLFLPNYFGGLNGVPKWYQYDISFNYVFLTVPGCLLALLGLVQNWRQRNFFWLALILLCIEISLGNHGRLGPLIYYVPLLNLFRNIPTFFDLANFALCLMAGIGAEALFSTSVSADWKKHVPAVLAVLLIAAAACGFFFGWWKIPGWYAMLAVFALSAIVVTGRIRNRLSVAFSAVALLALIAGQFVVYNMNQLFNWTLQNPRTYIARDVMMGRTDLLSRLREDQSADFRVAVLAESALSGNGWNVWRIPAIYGWNPVTLRRYDAYIRGFTETGQYTTPYGGPDHNLDSPMLDLLGGKYFVIADPDIERKLGLERSNKFTPRFELRWWKVYENRDYLSRSWFYPHAYVVPDEQTALALMSSSWFAGRNMLLFENGQVPSAYAALTEPLNTIVVNSNNAVTISSGAVIPDPYCSQPLPMVAGWGEQDKDRLQFRIPGPAQPGRYLLSAEYTANSDPAPLLEAAIESGDRMQSSQPRTLPMTAEWGCRKARHAELGTFELSPGEGRLSIAAKRAAQIHLYSLRLIRLPEAQSADAGNFSFSNFHFSSNRIAFENLQDRDGFLLLNEIFYPGWEARIDGQSTPILQADGVLRALPTRAGTHRVEMRFRPRGFAPAAWVSLTATAALTAYVALHRRRPAMRAPEASRESESAQPAMPR